MAIRLDQQIVPQTCRQCERDFLVVRGSVYDGGQPFGLYLIALHGHSPQGRLGHLAIAVLDRSSKQPRALAAAIEVIALPEQFGFSLIEWESSPWREETYLGEMLSREQAEASSFRPMFFHIAEHVVKDIPEARTYFDQPDAPGGDK